MFVAFKKKNNIKKIQQTFNFDIQSLHGYILEIVENNYTRYPRIWCTNDRSPRGGGDRIFLMKKTKWPNATQEHGK